MRTYSAVATVMLALVGLANPSLLAAEELFPTYKPSSRSPQAIDIRLSAYGASRDAPQALDIGERVQDFSVRRAGVGLIALREHRQAGPVVIVFYRGHW